jgi:hypothetical protein
MTVLAPRTAAMLGLACAVMLATTGCSVKTHSKDDNESASISIGGDADDSAGNGAAGNGAKTVSIDVPGFSAKVSVPDLDVGGKDTDIDGLRFYPGTKIDSVNINGHAGDGSGGESKGVVNMGFASPATPDALIGYYRDEAKRSGWTEVPPPAGHQFAATKPDEHGQPKQLVIDLAAAGSGSTGTFRISGG